jgi:glyoxylase-like metal-dependent hydrolase (beta-lactamase superfamily II)
MITKRIFPGVYSIPLGMVNAFLIDDGELTLIDTGIPGSEGKILQAIQELGKRPTDLRHILITHLHADHTGSLAAVKRASGAAVYMHPTDTNSYSQGQIMRPVQPAPGLVNRLLVKAAMRRRPSPMEVTPIENSLREGQVLAFAGGLRALHTPGHTAGHMAFLWPKHSGVLFVGDAASHMFGLGWSFIYEDLEQAQRILQHLGDMKFETACFSHGAPIFKDAAGQFKRKFG